MKTIEHDGQVYVLKSDMENAIQSRLQKMSARAADAEQQAAQLQETIDGMNGRLGALDNLQSQIDQYKQQLEQANGRFDRFQTVSKYGMTDPDQMELIEWQYERTMSKRNKKDQQSLNDWLEGLVQDPASAPIALRPHLQAIAQPQAQEATPAPQEAPQAAEALPQPPRMNNGAITAPPTTENLVERGLKDLDFYRENREAIKRAFYNRQ
jgi:TolA-binding protein